MINYQKFDWSQKKRSYGITYKTEFKMNKKEYIEKYTKEGMMIFPCASNGKIPLTQDFHKRAKHYKKWVDSSFECFQDANIGLITGKESDLFVLEIDPGVDTKSTIMKFLDEHYDCFNTRSARTPFGGIQYYFRYPKSVNRVASTPNLLDGVHIHADEGYVIAPGSNIYGVPYKFLDESKDIIEASEELFDYLLKSNCEMVNYCGPDNDKVGFWIDEGCKTLKNPLGSGTTISDHELYSAYKKWCKIYTDLGDGYLNERHFHHQMAEHGYVKKRTKHDDIYIGINPIQNTRK